LLPESAGFAHQLSDKINIMELHCRDAAVSDTEFGPSIDIDLQERFCLIFVVSDNQSGDSCLFC